MSRSDRRRRQNRADRARRPAAPPPLPQAAEPLVYRGMTVPYVTAYSAEVSEATSDPDLVLRPYPDGSRRLVFLDERPGERDHGVLWGRMRSARGEGVPAFASLHTGRQKEIVEAAACQICAGPGELWLTPATVWEEYLAVRGAGAPFETSDPPVCRTCLPTATTQCPNMRGHGWVVLAAKTWTITGVRGYVADPERGLFGDDTNVALPGARNHDPAKLALTLAKGLVVTLNSITAHTDPARVRGLGQRRELPQPPAPPPVAPSVVTAYVVRIPNPRTGD